MDLQQSLDRLCADIAGARLTAFGDMDAGLIFRTNHSSQGKTKREELDRLCATAKESYRLVQCLEDMGVVTDEDTKQSVVAFSSGESTIFSRCVQEPNEVICTVSYAGQPLDLAIQKSAACAAELTQDAE